jgi:integrase
MAIAHVRRKSTVIDLASSKRVAKRRFHFTKKAIEALPVPEGAQRAYYYDAQVRGLALGVAASGRRVFVLYRKVAGKPERITIGLYPDLSIEQARKRAEELNGAIAQGRNPATEKRRIRAESTLSELFDLDLESFGKLHKRTWPEDVAVFNRYLARWRHRKISTITRAEVLALHARLGLESGQVTANRTLALLRALFNRAHRDYGFEGKNPAAGITFFKERKRRRFLEGHELPAFFEALAQEPNETIRDYILVSLLTGARRSNVQALEWTEISWDRATWTIPATKAKADEPIDVALAPIVFRILQNRHATSVSKFAFPGIGKTGHLVEPKIAWGRILRRAGLTDLRLHDLRRTLGSWQAATGASLTIIGKSLGHTSLEATQVYARLDLDPVRASVERATQAMLLAGGVLAGGVAGLLEGK